MALFLFLGLYFSCAVLILLLRAPTGLSGLGARRCLFLSSHLLLCFSLGSLLCFYLLCSKVLSGYYIGIYSGVKSNLNLKVTKKVIVVGT